MTTSGAQHTRDPQYTALVALVAGLLTLIPPSLIGSGESARVVVNLEAWMHGELTPFAILHMHWFWLPRLIAFVTGSATSALVTFRFLVFATTAALFFTMARRFFERQTAILATAAIILNVTVLFFAHLFTLMPLTLLWAVLLLYLFTGQSATGHKIAAIFFGPGLSIGFWNGILLLAIVVVGLGYHEKTYTIRSRKTLILFSLLLLGVALWIVPEALCFGWHNLWTEVFHKNYPMFGTSSVLESLILLVFTLNFALIAFVVPGSNTFTRLFQPAAVILIAFLAVVARNQDASLAALTVALPCIVLVFVEKLHGSRLFFVGYVALNVGAFLILPAFANSPQIGMPEDKRTQASTDVTLNYYKDADLFSYSRLREQAAGTQEAMDLLKNENPDSTLVILDASTDHWFDEGTLGASNPKVRIGWFYGTPINSMRLDGLKDTAFIKPALTTPVVIGLFDKTYARELLDSALPPGTSITESERLQRITLRTLESRKVLIDRLIYLHYHSTFHGH